MDTLKKISESNNRDIIIQLGHHKLWTEYVIDFIKMRESDTFYELHIKDTPKTSSGCKCYLSHDGSVKGWIEIYSIIKFDEYTVIKMYPYVNKCDRDMAAIFFNEPYRYLYNNSFEQ
jgi:hypothetical protein